LNFTLPWIRSPGPLLLILVLTGLLPSKSIKQRNSLGFLRPAHHSTLDWKLRKWLDSGFWARSKRTNCNTTIHSRDKSRLSGFKSMRAREAGENSFIILESTAFDFRILEKLRKEVLTPTILNRDAGDSS
jgi:hypothetical protein